MSNTIEVSIPDIGDFTDVPVIEVLVKPGDRIKKNDSLVTLESEKAAMEVPSSADGIVESVNVKVGDRVSKGMVIVTVAGSDSPAQAPAAPSPASPAQTNLVELRVPDIGDFHDIPVIEVMIKPGDTIEKESPLATLESEKAAMDVPASAAGTIKDVLIKAGDKVSKGTVLATLLANLDA
ncbi:MAG: biotin/lipoyl-containing protein, partial [Candidatus Baltobacteraceae bacterium]